MKRPTATAATHPRLAEIARLLAGSHLSKIEQVQLLLEQVAPRYRDDPEGAVADLGRIVRRTFYGQ